MREKAAVPWSGQPHAILSFSKQFGIGSEHAREALSYFQSVKSDGATQMRALISDWLEQPCPGAEGAPAGAVMEQDDDRDAPSEKTTKKTKGL